MIDDDGRSNNPADNPFSSAAIASLPPEDPLPTTVPTNAIRETSAYLTEYLAARRTSEAGIALFVVGGPGSGKTHLLGHLLALAGQERRPDTLVVTLDAKTATFTALSRSFLAQIDPVDVRARLSRVLAADTERRLAPSGEPGRSPGDTALALRDVLSPATVPADRSALAAALSMLLQPERTAVAWQWLTGALPAADAVEQGLPTAADPQELTTEAMGAIAWLYGRTGGRLVVALDDVDRLIGASNRPVESSSELWGRVVETFIAAGTFLAMTGPPELLLALSDQVRQRLGLVVSLPPFDAADVESFIRQSQRRAFGEAELRPFTGEVTRYLAEVTGGVPRRVIRMCFHLFREAVRSGSRVTHAMVRSVVHTHFDAPSMPAVQAAIGRTLTEGGHEFHRDYLVPAAYSAPVDFWVFTQQHAAGCGVLVTESVLKPETVDDLARRLADIRHLIPDSATILVVVGHLTDELAAPLAPLLAADPIVYEPSTFADAFAGTISSVMRQLERHAGLDTNATTLERLHRQQAHTQRMIQHMTNQLDTVHTLADAGLSLAQRSAAADVGHARPLGSPPAQASHLPLRVRAVFADALNALGSLWRFDALLSQSFSAVRAPVESRENGVHWLLRPGNAAPALATSALLQRLIEAFQAGVEDWYRRRPERVDVSYDRELDRICGVYDTAAGLLPLFELNSLASFGALSGTGESGGWAMFDGLGARVSQAVRAQR